MSLDDKHQIWESPEVRALQAATATSWGDDALHAFIVQQKTLPELGKNAFGFCMDFGHGSVYVLLPPGIGSASPPCHAHLVKLTCSWLLGPAEQKFL